MIYQNQKGTVTVPTSDTVTSGTETREVFGQLGMLVVSVPALEGTGTATIKAVDDLGGTIIAPISTNESTIAVLHPAGTPTYFGGDLSIIATTTNGGDGTQSVNRDIVYNLYYEAKQG